MIKKKQINRVIRSLQGVEMAFIDLFCGAGGTSTGIEKAYVNTKKVASVVLCINHDYLAIQSHKANHPHAVHLVEDVRLVKMKTLIPLIKEIRRAYPKIKLCLWASLECTNFSKAKGGQARDADSRSLAWDLLRYIDCVRPDKIYIENVEEFMAWGPLDERGKPISKESGEDYIKWKGAVEACGFRYEHRIINSADLGAFQSRVRYFAQFATPGHKISWPTPTHSKKAKEGAKPWKPVREVLNLNDHGKSIFDRKKDLVPATLQRLYAGIMKHVLPHNDPFLVKYFGCGENAVSIDTVSPTITTKDRMALIQAQFIDKAFTSGGRHQSLESPSGAVTTVNKMSLVTCNQFLDKQYGSDANHQSVEKPAGAITTNPKLSLVTCQPFLVNPQWFNKGALSIDNPSPTLIARMDKSPLSIVTPEIMEATMVTVIYSIRKKPKPVIVTKNGNLIYIISIWDTPAMQKLKLLMACTGIVDIKMRMLEVDELLRIQGFPEDYVLKGGKTKQKWFIGNAVEVTTAMNIIRANLDLIHQVPELSAAS